MKKTIHPQALWWLSLIYALYAISYGVLFANLLLYSNSSTSIGFTENHAFQFFASFGTLTFILPLLGGFLCDTYGFVRVAKLGLALVTLGMLALASSWNTAFYIGVALCLTGNALVMPSIWSMVGMIYGKHTNARESGATLFYILFNIGFLIAFSLSSIFAQEFGFQSMFMVFSLGALSAFLVLMTLGNKIPNLPDAKPNYIPFILSVIAIFILIMTLLHFLMVNNIFMWLFICAIFIYLVVLVKNAKTQIQQNGIKAFMFLCFLGIIGITIYNSEFGLLPEFAQHAVNLQLGNIKLPAQIITSLDPLFCIVFGLLLSRLWLVLANKHRNPKLATKLSLGIIIPALGYLLLALAIYANIATKLPLIWLLPIFSLFVMGELLVMPIGIAMASQLAPTGKEGLFMGIWNVMQGFSALLTGYLAYFTVINTQQTQQQINIQYLQVFLYAGIVIVIIGIIAFVTRNYINKLL